MARGWIMMVTIHPGFSSSTASFTALFYISLFSCFPLVQLTFFYFSPSLRFFHHPLLTTWKKKVGCPTFKTSLTPLSFPNYLFCIISIQTNVFFKRTFHLFFLSVCMNSFVQATYLKLRPFSNRILIRELPFSLLDLWVSQKKNFYLFSSHSHSSVLVTSYIFLP